MSARFCRGKFSPSPMFICMRCLLESCALFAVWFTNDDSKIFSAAVHAGNRFTAIDVVMAHVCDLVRTRHSGLLRPRFAPLHAISTSGIITAMICFATFCAFACVCARVFVHACLHPHYSLFFLCSRLTSHSALRSLLFSCLWSAVSRSRSRSRSLFLVVVSQLFSALVVFFVPFSVVVLCCVCASCCSALACCLDKKSWNK